MTHDTSGTSNPRDAAVTVISPEWRCHCGETRSPCRRGRLRQSPRCTWRRSRQQPGIGVQVLQRARRIDGRANELAALAVLGVLSHHITNNLKRLVAGLIESHSPMDMTVTPLMSGSAQEKSDGRQETLLDQLARGRDIPPPRPYFANPFVNGVAVRPMTTVSLDSIRFCFQVPEHAPRQSRQRGTRASHGGKCLNRTNLHWLVRHPARMIRLNHAMPKPVSIEGFACLVNQGKPVNHEIRPVALCHHHFHQRRRQHRLS